MSIDLFGRQLLPVYKTNQELTEKLKLTELGDFDFNNHKLCNIADALNVDDAVNLKIMRAMSNELNLNFEKQINDKNEKIKSDFDKKVNDKHKKFESEIQKKTNDKQKKFESDFEKKINNKQKKFESDFEKKINEKYRILESNVKLLFDQVDLISKDVGAHIKQHQLVKKID